MVVEIYIQVLFPGECFPLGQQSGIPLETMQGLLLAALYNTAQVPFASAPVYEWLLVQTHSAGKSRDLLPLAPRYMDLVKAVERKRRDNIGRLWIEGVQRSA